MPGAGAPSLLSGKDHSNPGAVMEGGFADAAMG